MTAEKNIECPVCHQPATTQDSGPGGYIHCFVCGPYRASNIGRLAQELGTLNVTERIHAAIYVRGKVDWAPGDSVPQISFEDVLSYVAKQPVWDGESPRLDPVLKAGAANTIEMQALRLLAGEREIAFDAVDVDPRHWARFGVGGAASLYALLLALDARGDVVLLPKIADAPEWKVFLTGRGEERADATRRKVKLG